MTNRPTISAIVPVFDGTAYLAAAVTSILGQTRPVDEIVVVDDGSTDDPGAILAGFGDRVRMVRQENAGDAAARNFGVSVSSGDYLAFLDADDVWTPHKIEVQLAALRADAGPIAAFGHIVQFVSPELPSGSVPTPADAGRPVPAPVNGTLMIARSDFDDVGPFTEMRDGTGFVDWYARILDRGLPVTTVPEVVLHRRHHLGNLGRTHASTPAAYAQAVRRVIDRRRGRTVADPAR